MGQRKHGVDRKAVPGNHSARKTIHKNNVRKRIKAKRRKKRKKSHKQQDCDKHVGDSKGTRHGGSTNKRMGNSNGSSKQTDDWSIDKAHQNYMMKDLRDKQRPMISMLDDFLTPEKHDTWKQFLNLMEGIVHIPRGSLEKAKDIQDIMFILKTEGYCKTRIQAQTCLMKIIRRIDSNFARKVDPIFKNIVKLDQKSKAIKGLAEKKMTEDETVFQAGQVNGVCPPSKPIDLETDYICRTEQGNSNMRCAVEKKQKHRLNRKTGEKQTIDKQSLQGKSNAARKKQKRRKTSAVKRVRSLRINLTATNLTNNRVNGMMHRLESFGKWQHRKVRTGPLIDGGFSCTDHRSSVVECRECGIVLDVSDLNVKNPLEYHRTVAPGCKFVHEEDTRNTDRQTMDTPNTYIQLSSGHHPNCDYIKIVLVPSASNLQPIDTVSATNSFTEGLVTKSNQHDAGALNEQENENTMPRDVGGNLIFSTRNPIYTEENDRRETFTLWPHQAAHDIDILVNAGFFYTGTEDIVRCFYCDIGLAEWNPDDDPWVEHARHSPECPYLRDQKGQDYINNIQAQWARIYTPKHPQYAQMDTRRRSYQNAGWPRDNVLQTPEQLAASGFFYTGDGDTVRCHYCDGGLREWEPEDDPWVEHARWFPFCKFVLKIKGIDFIQASATGNPANGLQAPVAPPAAPRINEPPLTLSFVDKCRIKEQKNPMHSAAAQSMRTMGYSRGTIRMVIDKFLVQTGRRDFKAVDLMDIIMAEEEAGRTFPESDGEDDGEETGATAGGAAAGGLNAIDLDEEMDFSPAAMRKENEYLKQKFKCKVCCQRERCMVFAPCGHRITCQRCGEQANTCPHCKSRIDQRFKTYLG